MISYSDVDIIDGRIWPVSLKERLVADKSEAQISHVLACKAGENIARGDYAELVGGSLWVEVLGPMEPSQAGEHWEVDCMERQYEEVEELVS